MNLRDRKRTTRLDDEYDSEADSEGVAKGNMLVEIVRQRNEAKD